MAGNTPHILIVDDQRPFQLMLKGILHSLGYRHIDFAHHGELALQRCQQQRYQIIFIDYNLGTGKNGRQLLDDLRQFGLLDPDAICMLVTGENTVPMVISAVELEPDDYLMKPFSQSVLRMRLQRIQQKKQQLLPLYQAMSMKDWPTAEVQARFLLTQAPRYAPYLRRILVQALLHTRQIDAARTELSPLLAERRPPWALLQLARIELESGQHPRCQQLCEEALAGNKYLVEAYDLQSENLARSGDPDHARQLLKKALEISPFQLQRLEQFFQLSVATDQQEDWLAAARQMYELTRRAGSNDPRQLLNYVRCLLNAACASTDPGNKNRLQQESLLLIHRARRDEHLLRKIDYEMFEKVCMARLDAADGRQLQARRSCLDLVTQYVDGSPLAADLAMLCDQVNEYELSEQLQAQLLFGTDSIAERLWQQQQQQIAPQRLAFSQFSRQGLSCYQSADYAGATQNYEQALQLAPLHSSTQLNLLQSLLQYISTEPKPTPGLAAKPLELLRRIRQQALSAEHQERLQQLQEQFDALKAQGKTGT